MQDNMRVFVIAFSHLFKACRKIVIGFLNAATFYHCITFHQFPIKFNTQNINALFEHAIFHI